MDTTWLLAVVPFLSAGLGAYFGGYLKRKGENLATHEDIDKLVEQVRKVTTTAKEIEAKISSEMWDRQKRWEIKREILFEAIRRLAALEEGLVSLDAVVQVELSEAKKDTDPGWLESKVERKVQWSPAIVAYDETFELVQTICDPETVKAFFELNLPIKKIGRSLSVENDATIFKNSMRQRVALYDRVRSAVRKELIGTGPT